MQTAISIAMGKMGSLIELANANFKVIPGPVVNVQGYGAVGDGVTDDTLAIQQARNDLENGGELYFPAGNYIYSGSPLIFSSGERITIQGTSESFITFKNMDKGIVLGDGVTNKNGVRFNNIGLVGVNTNYGIYANNYSSLRADYLKLTGFSIAGFYGFNAWLSKFNLCEFRNNALALSFNTSANGVVLSNCYFILNTVGVKILGTSGFTISQGSFEQHSQGIVVDTGVLRSLSIKDVYFEANTNGSIVLDSKDKTVSTYWKGIDIHDCYFTCIDTPYGIVVNTLNSDSSNNTNIMIIGSIRNNTFANNGSAAYVAGIKLTGNRVYIKAENNRAYNMSNGNDITVYQESGSNSNIKETSFSSEILTKGTIEFASATNTNLVLTSANGTKYKLKVGDSGTLFTSL